MNFKKYILPIVNLIKNGGRMSIIKEEMENFFIVLAEREKQYYIAKGRYEESLKLLEKMCINKKERFIKSLSVDGGKIEEPAQFIDELPQFHSPEVAKFDHQQIPDKNLLDDIKEILKKNKKPMTGKEIHEELIIIGRVFDKKNSLDIVYMELQLASNNLKGICMVGRDKWSLDDWIK